MCIRDRTGPTGSGKSTTLYAALNRLGAKKINRVTVEDPVEKVIPGVTQVQVNAKSGLTFAAVLRSILRQDPDVIMVGEMRDEETADIGVRAAVTGHLVLSTLHTNDCVSVIYRLKNMGIPFYMIAAALTGVVAQRLVKDVYKRQDPMILLSYINTQLRDNYSSLGEMCQILDLDELHIRKTLSDIGFEYVSEKNCFR